MGRQMGFSGQSHAWRAIVLACGLAWLGSGSGLKAETLAVAAPDLAAKSAEPFGISATALAAGSLHDKWLGLQHRLDDDMGQLALCDGEREGRANLGEINRAINLAIRSVSDEAQYGETDVWSPPLASFIRGAGDCEDYAIAKFAALRLAGIAPGDLRILIMRDTVRAEYHAVAAARLAGRWVTLDNRRMAM